MSQQGLRQASVRAVTGTTLDHNGDWSALFDMADIAPGDFNGRLIQWIGLKLERTFTDLNSALQALAEANGAYNFESLGTFDAALTSPTLEELLVTLEAAGKLVCAWFLPTADPDQYLTLDGTDVTQWDAAYGSAKINLAQDAEGFFPAWDASAFGGTGAVQSVNVLDSGFLTGLSAPSSWPGATSDLYMVLGGSLGLGNAQAFSYGSSLTNCRAIQVDGALHGRGRASTLTAAGATVVVGAYHALGWAVDIGGTSTLYVDGVADGSVATASAALTLSRVRLFADCTATEPGDINGASLNAAIVLNGTASLSDFIAVQTALLDRVP